MALVTQVLPALPAILGLGLGAVLGWALEVSGFSFDLVFRGGRQRGESRWLHAYAFALSLIWIGLGVAALFGRGGGAGGPTVSPTAAMPAGFATGLLLAVLANDPVGLSLDTGFARVRGLVAFAAWVAGAWLAARGPLALLGRWFRDAGPAELKTMSLDRLVWLPPWVVLLAAGGGTFAWLLRQPVRVAPGTLEWPKLGAWLAGLTAAGWWLGREAGTPGGLNALGALEDAWAALGGGKLWLSPSLLAGLGLLGYGLARSVARPHPHGEMVLAPAELAIRAGAGLLLGTATVLAAGDPAAHAFFGVGRLSLGSVVYLASLGCGSWLMGLLEWQARGRPGAAPAKGYGV